MVSVKYCLDFNTQWLDLITVTQVHILLQVLHRMGPGNHRDLLYNSSCCLHRILCNDEQTKKTWKCLLTIQTLEMGFVPVSGCNPLGDHYYSCVLDYPVAWIQQPFVSLSDHWDDVSSVPSCVFDHRFLHEPSLLWDRLDLHSNWHLPCLRSCEYHLYRRLWKSCVSPNDLGFFWQLADWIVDATPCCCCVYRFILPH